MIRPNHKSSAPIALLSMPWASPRQPNIALGVIKAQLAKSSIAADVVHPCIELACSLGFRFYDHLAARHIWPFLGEWLFSRAAFGSDAQGDGPSSVAAWLTDDTVAERLEATLGGDYAERL